MVCGGWEHEENIVSAVDTIVDNNNNNIGNNNLLITTTKTLGTIIHLVWKRRKLMAISIQGGGYEMVVSAVGKQYDAL